MPRPGAREARALPASHSSLLSGTDGGFVGAGCHPWQHQRSAAMLAACLIFKDSASYLEEWLLFHYVQGFRRFYLYDNGSSDAWREAAEPWIRLGFAEVTHFPGLGVQRDAYDHCLAKARDEADWLAFIDDDEFLFSPVGARLEDLLNTYRAHAGVAVSWKLFGSGGALRRRPGWVIERFTACAPGIDPHVKCVVQPGRVLASAVIGHAFLTPPGDVLVDEQRRPLATSRNPSPSAAHLRINHYLVKSWEEWRLRRSRPQADTGVVTPHNESAWRAWDADWSYGRDTGILRHLPAMRGAQRQLFAFARARTCLAAQ